MRLSVLLLAMLCGFTASAQTTDNAIDSIIKKVNYYRAKKSGTMLFVHLDKTVYVNNEIVWFTGYLLGAAVKDMPRHSVLAAALVNNNNQAIAVQGKFAMSGGLAYGNLTLPDTIPPGHYSFIAYTNYLTNGRPDAYFVQPVTIKTVTQPPFNVELALDTLYKDPINVRILLKAEARSAPLDGAAVNYYLGKDVRTRLAGKAKTNGIGSYTLLLPKDHITSAQHNLEVQVKFGADVKTLHLDIPIKKQTFDVKFYPEGGQLVTGFFNRVGWEVKTAGGTAIKTTALLYANKDIIDTITTDSYGMGAFNMIPVPNVNYTVKLPDVGTDEQYHLPATLNDGLVMHLNNPLAEDTLKLSLQNKVAGQVTVLVHNYKQVYAVTRLAISPLGRSLKVDLSAIPRGLNTITILDSLQRPCAERLFFAHYNLKPRLSMSVDNKEPGMRQKVHVKLKLNSANGMPIQGIVSVACVQDNRFEIKNDNNIEHYVYLQSQIDDLPLKDSLMGNKTLDRQYLNELLLVRGWSKYKWPELLKAAPADTMKFQDSLLFRGLVTRFTTLLKKPVPLLMIKDSSYINMLNTNEKGEFIIANELLYTPPEKKIRLIVSGNSSDYSIKITDPYIGVNKILANNIEPLVFEPPVSQNTKELVLKGFEHATALKEVKIKAGTDFLHGGKNACGDYVCVYGILNCPNHVSSPGNRGPVTGEVVIVPAFGPTKYEGCDMGATRPGMSMFPGIYIAKEFYSADYTKVNPVEPDYLSTICWKYGVRVSSANETEISFYTSDITGKFRIVVQGITTEDVVYGEDIFVVQKKAP